MPQRDGYDICATLRKNGQFENTPVILYSGEETSEFIQRGEQAGATLCLRKTSKSSELLAGIEEVFLNQKSLAEGKIRSPTSNEESADAAESNGLAKPVADSFDISVALENVDGDHQLLHELVHVMLEDTPHILQRLQQAVNERDPQAIRLAAHSLKSSVAILGASAAAEAAAQLESAGQSGEIQNPERLYDDLSNRIDQLMEALTHQFGQPTPS